MYPIDLVIGVLRNVGVFPEEEDAKIQEKEDGSIAIILEGDIDLRQFNEIVHDLETFFSKEGIEVIEDGVQIKVKPKIQEFVMCL